MSTAIIAAVRAATRLQGGPATIVVFADDPQFAAAFRAGGHQVVNGSEAASAELELVVCPHEERSLAAGRRLADAAGVPLVCVWMAAPQPGWTASRLAYAKSLRGDVDVFPVKEMAEAWGLKGVVAGDVVAYLSEVACR